MPLDPPRTAESARTQFKASHLLILAALTLFALAVRLNGIDSMLPHRIIGDERVFLTALARIRHESSHPAYPMWFGYYPEGLPALASLVPNSTPDDGHGPVTEHLSRASRDLLVLRTVCALIATLAIPATYFLAQRLLSSTQGLWAAAIVAASLLHVWYSQQARPHAATSSIYVLAVLFSCRAMSRGTLGAYTIAGSIVGCALGLLQSGVFVIPPLLLAHFLGNRYVSKRPAWLLAIPLVIGALAMRAFYPFAFEAPLFGARLDSPQPGVLREETDVAIEQFRGGGFRAMLRGLADHEPLMLAFAVVATVGAVLWVRRVRARPAVSLDLVVVLSFVLPYLVVFGLFDRTYQRYVIPLLPFVAMWIVWGVAEIAAAIGVAAVKVALACALLALGAQGYAAVHMSRVRSADDTQEQAARWIELHVQDTGARIALMPTLDLPLARTQSAFAQTPHLSDPLNFPWTAYQCREDLRRESFAKFSLETMPFPEPDALPELLADPDSFLDSLGAEYVVVEVYAPSRHRPAFRRLRESARESRPLLARFSPCRVDEGDDTPFLYRDQYNEYPEPGNWAVRSLHMQRMGPVIEIYGPAAERRPR